MMKPVHTFTVVPSLPPAIENLREVAYNLSWCWSHDSIALFRRLDSDLWDTCGHNCHPPNRYYSQSEIRQGAARYQSRCGGGNRIG